VKNERRLGRGLESLLGRGEEVETARDAADVGARQVPLSSIRANPMQPRVGFEEREMSELVESVRAVGILQPLLVRRRGEGFEIIAGERRFRAAQLIGLETVPIIEREASDEDMLTLALVENLQREDLNPMEKAKGFGDLIERFEITQEEAARRVGKDRSTIANFIRLLDLPESVQHVVSRGTISMGHARALLGIPHASAQQAMALRIEEEGLSVREVERLVARMRTPKSKAKSAPKPPKSSHIRDLEDRLRERLGAKVALDVSGKKGRITIHFFNDDDLQRVLDILGVSA